MIVIFITISNQVKTLLSALNFSSYLIFQKSANVWMQNRGQYALFSKL